MANPRDIVFYDDEFTEFRDELNKLNIFSSLVDLYVFCGGLGFSENLYIETKKSGLGVPQTVEPLKNNRRKIEAIALQKSEDLSEPIDFKESCKLFSGFVNGGFTYLRDYLTDIKGDQNIRNEIILLIETKALKNIKKKS